MILNKEEIIEELINTGCISGASIDNVNVDSLDIVCGPRIWVESPYASVLEIDSNNDSKFHITEQAIFNQGFLVRPGQPFMLETIESFKLPSGISAMVVLRSSVGRMFIDHLNSTLAHPGFNGKIRLELINSNQQHSVRVTEGCCVAQLIFMRSAQLPGSELYNGQFQEVAA